MKQHTKKEIEAECIRIWDGAFGKYNDGKVEVNVRRKDQVAITISQMYEYVEMNLSHLMALAEFFGTKNINDTRYSSNGCETCDYGSSYTITLTIKPEVLK